ncbi:hypothetical protein Forpe1208_v017011 [Fusarium oxysporum f. sp. rapae]|uniref:Uncharacterized protein n=1 Tax=Fusarium oxysporum f. sp. rapae TaxID=485398 RepID=A0A8J5TWL3_FUSOX|nr:hypothetical protein Forpe1208_v017011 [Fusarium oxysporum f. sp. rapae]
MQELLRYLRRIDHFWSQICPTSGIKRKVDAATIEILDNQAPGSVQDAFDQKGLFIDLEDAQRDLVWTRILEATRDRTVPTVHSFFRNLGYLGAVAYSMDRLRDPPPSKCPTKDCRQKRKKRPEFKRDSQRRVSLRQGLQDGFQKDAMDAHVIQASENCYKLVHAEHIDRFELGYQTLWAFCLRWHPMLPRLESDHRVIGETDQEQSVLAHFAKLAHRIGFRSSRINDIQQQSTATGLVNRQEASGSIMRTLSSPDALIELSGAGKPSKKALDNMRHMLFMPNFYNTTAEMLAFPPFFVQRSLYLDIFSSCQADAITTMLCTGLQGQDHIIVEAQNERRLEDNVERCLGRQLAEARDTISQLRISLETLQEEHATCRGLKAELEKRSLASLKQAQDAEFSRSVLQQQLHDLQHSRSKDQWAAPGHRKLLQSVENDQQPLQDGPDQEKATAGGNMRLALPDSDMPDRDLDVSNEAPPYQWSSQEALDIRFEDASSQYSQSSLLTTPGKPDSQAFQVKILSDTWGDDRIVQVNEEYLSNFIEEFQDKDYKIFDNEDRVLTPTAVANLPLSERYIVLKPYFDITTQRNGHSRPA